MVTESNGSVSPPPHELESFLPKDGENDENVVSIRSKDEAVAVDFDPFTERVVKNPTSNTDTLIHLLKASLGTGILAMPKAFKASGLFAGIFFAMIVSCICTHCAYTLIKCAHILYKKTKRTTMTFADVGAASLTVGPHCLRKWSYTFRMVIMFLLFITYFGTCSVYTVIIAENIQRVLDFNFKRADEEHFVSTQMLITFLIFPLIIMVWIRNLKYLAPVSMIANVFMGIGLGITFFFLVGTSKLDFSTIKFIKPVSEWPEFFSITIFAIEAIGVVMPIENSMRDPEAMLGLCGVLNKGMSGVTIVYILLGFLGYMRYGEFVNDSVTLNLRGLPEDPAYYNVLAQIVQGSIALAVYCTFGLQFFVCVEIIWNAIKEKFSKHPDLAEYITRTIMVTVCVLLAVAVPTIAPFMGVIGALCFSLLGLIAPAFIEILTYWDIGYGPFKYVVVKNIIIVIFGLFALVFGTKDAVTNMMNMK